MSASTKIDVTDWGDRIVRAETAKLKAEITALRALIRTIGETHLYDNHKGEFVFGSDLVILLDSDEQAELLRSIVEGDS